MSALACALLGVVAAMEWLAAAYGLIDHAFDSARHGRRTRLRLGLLTLALLAFGAALPAGAQRAFFVAVCAYLVFHVVCHVALRWLAGAWSCKTSPIE